MVDKAKTIKLDEKAAKTTEESPDLGHTTPDIRQVAGNMAIQQLLHPGSKEESLSLVSPDDASEREAAASAGQTVSPATSPSIQRKPLDLSTASSVKPSVVFDVLKSSPGSPLNTATRTAMEGRFGQSLGDVRLHTGSQAAESAQTLGARAYTFGKDIVFGAGQYSPQTPEGSRLLTHELVHVLQQAGCSGPGPAAGVIQRQPQESSGAETTGPGASVNQALSGLTGVPTTMQSVEFRATLGAGQVLTSDADKTVHTVSDTHVIIRATRTGLTVTFTPELVITSNEWHGANIWLEQVSFDFTTARFSWNASARGITWLFGGSSKLTSGLATLLNGLPAAMRTPGYDPFADPNLQSNLAAFAAGLSAGGSAGAGMPRATGLGMRAEFTLGGEIRRSAGSFSIVIPSGTQVSVDISLQGGIPTSFREVRVDSIRLQLYHPLGESANVELRIADAGLPVVFVHGVTFSAGGRLQFDYTLATEVLEGFFRLLAAAEAVRAGRGGEVGEGALDPSQPRLHAVVDAQVRQHLEPMLRELILNNRRAIPGIDLGEVLGFGPEMGDFPIVPPAGPGTAYG